LLAFTAEVQ